MNETGNWRERANVELARGIRARKEGNEGMARVCARRAAGIIIAAYYAAEGAPPPGSSVLNHLRALRDSPDASDAVRETAARFLLQITPDHVLPGDVDLIAEVERLRDALFPEADSQKK